MLLFLKILDVECVMDLAGIVFQQVKLFFLREAVLSAVLTRIPLEEDISN